MTGNAPFWEHKTLEQMTDSEWESLCDGCGRCCIQKLEDEETGQIHTTDVACKLLDVSHCRCRHYEQRFERVSDCLSVRPLSKQKLSWLPTSCAYKRLAEGRSLAKWHPLISGSAQSVHRAGIGMANRCVSESDVPAEELTQHIIIWPADS